MWIQVLENILSWFQCVTEMSLTLCGKTLIVNNLCFLWLPALSQCLDNNQTRYKLLFFCDYSQVCISCFICVKGESEGMICIPPLKDCYANPPRMCTSRFDLSFIFILQVEMSFLESSVSLRPIDCGRTVTFLRLKPSLCHKSNFIMQIPHWKHDWEFFGKFSHFLYVHNPKPNLKRITPGCQKGFIMFVRET